MALGRSHVLSCEQEIKEGHNPEDERGKTRQDVPLHCWDMYIGSDGESDSIVQKSGLRTIGSYREARDGHRRANSRGYYGTIASGNDSLEENINMTSRDYANTSAKESREFDVEEEVFTDFEDTVEGRSADETGVSGSFRDDSEAHFESGDGENSTGEVSDSEESSVSCSVLQLEDDFESWKEEYLAYLEQTREFRAKLQYEVRVVLIAPMFEVRGRKLSAFPEVYKRIIGKTVESTGFSSSARLCRVMPHVVQRKFLEDGKLVLVESRKNCLSVAIIRSGLRRIVYNLLKSCKQAISMKDLERRCTKVIGEPLDKLLGDYGYEPPRVESMARDMLDLAYTQEMENEIWVHLCSGAEDPTLTDGLLIGRSMKLDPSNQESGLNDLQSKKRNVVTNLKTRKSTGLQTSTDEEILQARFRLRILLAFHNSGQGVEVDKMAEEYERFYSKSFLLHKLDFASSNDLAKCWQDIFLVKNRKPYLAYLVPSWTNKRIVNTLKTGLRSTVFSALVDLYPEGRSPLDFLQSMQNCLSGRLLEVLSANGYILSDLLKTRSLSSWGSDFQLGDFEELCTLVDDMMDFVRLGSTEDGSLVVKLRDGEFPLLDSLDCNMEESDIEICEQFTIDHAIANTGEGSGKVNNRYNPSDNTDENWRSTEFHLMVQGDEEKLTELKLLLQRERTFTRPGAVDDRGYLIQRLKHDIRLIVGSPANIENGISWNDLKSVYRTRKRRGLNRGKYRNVKKLMSAMPDVICTYSLLQNQVCLAQNPKNHRIISATKAGMRQVLHWALLKNPGGVWPNLMEGWYTDFAGISLSSTLENFGYERSHSMTLFPILTFLKDMRDIVWERCDNFNVFIWAGELEDPTFADAELLGLPVESIQYDPLREECTMNAPLREQDFEEVDRTTEESFNLAVQKMQEGDSNACIQKVDSDDALQAHASEEQLQNFMNRGTVAEYQLPSEYAKLRCPVTETNAGDFLFTNSDTDFPSDDDTENELESDNQQKLKTGQSSEYGKSEAEHISPKQAQPLIADDSNEQMESTRVWVFSRKGHDSVQVGYPLPIPERS